MSLEILTAATLLVLIWYTIETYKLRKAAQAQVETATMPMVVFQSCTVEVEKPYGIGSGEVYRPLVRNLGTGPAFNVIIQPIQVADRVADFEFPRMLAPREEQFVAICGLIDAPTGGSGKIRDKRSFQGALQACKDRTSTKGVISYTSASGKRFQTIFTILHNSSEFDSFVLFDCMKEI